MAAPLYSRGASLIVRLEGQRVAGLRAGPEWPACGPGQSGRLAGRARVAGLRAGPGAAGGADVQDEQLLGYTADSVACDTDAGPPGWVVWETGAGC